MGTTTIWPKKGNDKLENDSKDTKSLWKGPWEDYWDDDYDYYNYYNDKYSYPVKNESSKSKVEKEDEELPLFLVESFDEELVKEISLQLLTGSVIINKDSIDVDKWVSKMDSVYEKRFGKLFSVAKSQETIENTARLTDWITGMIDFLIYTKDEKLLARLKLEDEYVDENDTSELCAFSIYAYLTNLPESKVKDLILNILSKYLPYGVEEYI